MAEEPGQIESTVVWSEPKWDPSGDAFVRMGFFADRWIPSDANAIHPLDVKANGKPMFDGYLIGSIAASPTACVATRQPR
jgi:hypothetical protein